MNSEHSRKPKILGPVNNDLMRCQWYIMISVILVKPTCKDLKVMNQSVLVHMYAIAKH